MGIRNSLTSHVFAMHIVVVVVVVSHSKLAHSQTHSRTHKILRASTEGKRNEYRILYSIHLFCRFLYKIFCPFFSSFIVRCCFFTFYFHNTCIYMNIQAARQAGKHIMSAFQMFYSMDCISINA